MPFEIPFSAPGSKGPNKNQSFADPGPMPDALTRVPGFIGELTDWTISTSPSPNRVLAFAGALAMLAHLTGRSHTDLHGTHTNLYLVVLGESGIGKDSPRKTNSRLAQRVGFSQSIAEAFASGEAIEDALVKCPSMLFQADEVASFFGKMRGTNTAAKSMSERIRRLFTSSGSTYVVRAKAGLLGGQQIIFPQLTMFGTGVPDEFLAALTPHEIRDGLFGRCLILRAEDEYVSQSAEAYTAFPESVVKTAELLAAREKASIESGVMAMKCVPETPEAVEALEQVKTASMSLRKALSDAKMPMARATVVRMNEKIAKLALLWAISENAENPQITRAAVEWATALTVYVTRWMLFESQFHSGEGNFGLLRDRAVASLARNGGSMDRRTLLRNLGCDITTFKRLVTTLVVSEIIDEPSYVEGKLVYSLRNN
jgi:hypothetical protein